MELTDAKYKATPLGELQWWSFEVLSGSVFGIALGVMAGKSDLGLLVTLLIAAGALAGIFVAGALFRHVRHSRDLYVKAPPDQVYDALLANAGRGPMFQSLWGISLRVDRMPQYLEQGSTIDAEYEFRGRKGSLKLTVAEADRPRRLVQRVSNRFRGRITHGIEETVLEPSGDGTLVKESCQITLPLSASHFIGAVYARMVVSKTTQGFLRLLKRTAEGPLVR